MTNPAQAIALVVSIVAIVGAIGALRLTPDAGTDKLVDNGTEAFEGTQEFRDRFGDDAIVVLAQGDLRKLVRTRKRVTVLLNLETCLSGNVPEGQRFPDVCNEISELGATRVVFGPATFINQAAQAAGAEIQGRTAEVLQSAQAAQLAAQQQVKKAGGSRAEQAQAGQLAYQQVLAQAFQEYSGLISAAFEIGSPGLFNSQFVDAIVFDSSQPSGTPKSKFGYLFPSPEGALISIRLDPDLDDETRREAIGLIREAVGSESFALEDGSYEISGVPVVVEGLADSLSSEIVLLFAVAILVMALTLIFAFGPPLQLLPLGVALGAAGISFGLLSLVGGSLTMASVAVLPVVIGLGVDYTIQLQARFREALAGGARPAAAAVTAAVTGGPVIGTAALATGVGFLALVLSPIPMVREFALSLVIGVAAALGIALTAGLAALSIAQTDDRRRWLGRARAAGSSAGSAVAGKDGRFSEARESFGSAGERIRETWSRLSARLSEFGSRAIALSMGHAGKVLVVAVLLAGLGWGAATRTEVTSDIRELVPADLPALESVDALQEVTGVSGELDLIVSGDDVTTPEAITWMRDVRSRILTEQGFVGENPTCRDESAELCPGPALPELITTPEPTQQRIDDILSIVPGYFLDAILSRPEGEEQVANISFLIPVMPLDEQEALIEEIRAGLDPPEGLRAELVGLPVLAADANAELSSSRYWLVPLGLLMVAIALLAVYRSPRRALVPLIPVALATGWSSLVVELSGIPLNPMSATLGVLVIAVATEFAVILAARFQEERDAGSSVGAALRTTYGRTGAAVIVSGLTSIAGFGVLIASGITMLSDFGVVTVVDLSVSLAGVLFVLPAALVWAETSFGGSRASVGKAIPPAAPGEA